MKPVIVTKELVSIGLNVMRGKNWIYGDQDGGAGNRGKVISLDGDEWCNVLWDNGKTYGYRTGYVGENDLYVYIPGFYSSKPQGKVRLTEDNVKVGLYVELRNDGTQFAKEHLSYTKGRLLIKSHGGGTVSFQGYHESFKVESFDICENQNLGTYATGKPEPLPVPPAPTPIPAPEPIYKYRKGDLVYLGKFHADAWTANCGVRYDTLYTVEEVRGSTMRIRGISYWQRQDQFIGAGEWLSQKPEPNPYASQHIKVNSSPAMGIKDLQQNVVSLAENLKPNKNSQNGNNKHPEPIKVRRPVSTIQGSKRRTGAVYSGGRSSSGSRISNY